MLINQHHYQLFADYFQFILQDEKSESSWAESWAEKQSQEIGLAIAPGIIAVGTERNFTVPVTLEIHDSEPNDDFSVWDKVNECSIEISSGTLAILGCTDHLPEAARIQVEPQIYRARIYYGGLETVVDFDKGDDRYKVVLWPAPYSELKILKKKAMKNAKR
jgi:hypothetical protein